MTLQPYARVAGGPLAITWPDDGSGRLFVAAQDGRAWVVRGGTTVDQPLLDIRAIVTSGGERGLLGIATHPGFATDSQVFVDYTDRNGDTVVASYAIDPANPDRLDPATARPILHVGQPYPNHNGGAVAFGPDGDLYVSLGDGGGAGDPQGNGQRLDTTLGKVLRIDVDHPSNGRAYGIPAGNPFVGNPLSHPEILLYGLRNPWRMAFDRLTGSLWIGDVGQNAWEEVDVAGRGVGGLNFGWNRMEGDHCFAPASGCDQSGLTPPVTEYSHDGGACVVIGGIVYRGDAYPVLRGAYLYSDFCTGTIWALAADAAAPVPAVVGAHAGQIAAYGEDEAGNAYAASLDGTLNRVMASPR
ncbi:MAG TPA: PQQ-dependent sugar dehydrogenase [Candidatus Limnocylindrales bacterium]|nr:PQQ-dependent sugar dehydrogenase [Candidatus Limnocylindrales bacterium]